MKKNKIIFILLILKSIQLFSVDVSIVPSTFLRGWDPVTLFFSEDVGPNSGGSIDNPTEYVNIEPNHPGEYRWIDSRTLQFNPTITWPPLSNFKISSMDKTQFLSTMMVQPTRVYPSPGSTNLDPIQSFKLVFNTDVKVAFLQQITTIDVRPLPGVGEEDSYILSSKDFVISKEESGSNLYNFNIKLKKSIPYGKNIRLKLALSTDSTLEGATAIYNFSTKDDFRIISMGSNYTKFPISSSGSVYNKSQSVNCGTGSNPLFIEFSENPQVFSIEDIKKLVSFEPSVSNLDFTQSGNKVYLRFNVDKETPYKFIINSTKIKSKTGRELAKLGETSLFFYYQNQSPFISWKAGQVLTEKFGPKFFPMEGRAIDSVDLRIYKIDADDEKFWPYPSNPVIVNEDKMPLMPGEDENAKTIEDHIKLLSAPPVSVIEELPISKNSGKTSFGLDLDSHFTSISGKNRPGTYLVGYRTLGSSNNRNYVKVIVTDLSLTTVEEESGVNFIITSLDSGLPIPGTEIKLESYVYNKDTSSYVWESQISGVTDKNGYFYIKHDKELREQIGRIRITKDNDILILDTKNPPPSFYGNHWYSRGDNWLGWLNIKPQNNKLQGNVKGYIFTERPVYKPNEDVHIMGYVRYREKGEIKKDTSSEKILTIYGPGRKKWEYPVLIEGNGQFYHLFNIKDLPTGEYEAAVSIKKTGEELAYVTFKKEAYVVPKFEINITGDHKVPADKPFEVELVADFYAGGRVIDQSVNWYVTKYPYFASSKNFPGFTFAIDERFSGYSSDYSIGSESMWDKTDENGTSKLLLNPASERGITALRYIIEATVRGADSQTVTDSKEVLALPPFSLGIKVERLNNDKENIKTEVVMLDINDEPLGEKEFTLRMYKREWHSYLAETDFTTGDAKYLSDVVDTKIYEENYVTEKDGATELNLKTEESGVYLIEVLTTDQLGRLQRVKSVFYVAGETPISWEKTQTNIFDTILDKKSYNPGDKLTMLLKSPFQEAYALVVVENSINNEYFWVPIKNGQGIFNYEIKNNMVPGLPIHTLLMRGRIPGSGIKNYIDMGKPISMGNTTWVNINPINNKLVIGLDHKDVALPGEEITMKIELNDAFGQKVDGDVTLWLVDRAVLALGYERNLNPLDAFIDPVRSFISIKDIRNSVVGNIPVQEAAGGGGYDEVSASLMKMAEADLLDNKSVRKNFKTVAYFNKRISVKNGVATVKIPLPDNLTDFSVRAVASSDFDKFGVAKSQVSIRLPVIIQSAMPRFVRPGDNITAGGIARVVEGKEGRGTVIINSKDVIFENGNNSLVEKIDLKKAPLKLFYPMSIPSNLTNINNLKISMGVQRDYDGVKDAFEMELPVSYLNMVGSKSIVGQISEGDLLTFPKPKVQTEADSINQTIFISSNESLIKIFTGLQMLEEFPHGCLEQRISKLYPLLSLQNILKDYNIPNSFKVDNNSVDSFLNYLDSVTNKSGLFSLWPGSDPYIGLSAYTLEFLILLKKNGFIVKDSTVENSVESLKRSLRSDSSYLISKYSLTQRIDAFYALSEYGYFDRNYASDLLDGAVSSNLYNKANMVIAYYKNGRGSDSRINELVKQLWSATTFKKQGNKEIFTGLQYNKYSWGDIILSSEITTLSKVIQALYIAEPQNTKLELMINYLINQGSDNGWGSTKETSSALLAIADTLKLENKNIESYKFNDQTRTLNNSLDIHSIKSDKLATISYEKGKTPLYYWLQTSYKVSENLRNIQEESTGFLVTSELIKIVNKDDYFNRSKVKAGDIIEFNKDDVVEQHVSIINSQNSTFVAITIPLAAGFEPLNPELLTSPPEAIPSGKITRTPSYSLYLDDKVTFYYDELPKGNYDFYFRLRATTKGDFYLPPAYAERMYQMSYRGMSNAGTIRIND